MTVMGGVIKKHVSYVFVVCLSILIQLLYVGLGDFDPNLGVNLAYRGATSSLLGVMEQSIMTCNYYIGFFN